MLLCPRGPKNQFKSVQQNGQHGLRAYCPNRHIVIDKVMSIKSKVEFYKKNINI